MFSLRKSKRRLPRRADNGGVQRISKHGRPMKRPEDLAIPRSIKNAKLLRYYQQMQPEQKTADPSRLTLEHLPNEILQQIFYRCFEVNLIRASQTLTQAFSDESTYRILILFAFFEDDGESLVEEHHFLPAPYIPMSVDDRVRLQAAIIGCKWFTVERVQACLPILSRLSMVQAWNHERKAEKEVLDQANDPADRELEQQVSQGLGSLPRLEDSDAMVKHYFATTDLLCPICVSQANEDDIEQHNTYLPRIITWDAYQSLENEEPKVVKCTRTRTSILGTRVLPDSTVNGSPWTQGKLMLLQLLREGSRFNHKDAGLKVSAEALLKGMASAIVERNSEVLRTLLEIHSDVFEVVRSDEVDGERTQTTLHTPPLPLSLFHLAAKVDPHSSQLMWLLLRGSIDSIPVDDAKLTSWALKQQDDGDQVAEWLLDYMSDASNSTTYNTGHIFWQGALCRPAARFQLLPCPTFWQELKYLRGARPMMGRLPAHSQPEPTSSF